MKKPALKQIGSHALIMGEIASSPGRLASAELTRLAGVSRATVFGGLGTLGREGLLSSSPVHEETLGRPRIVYWPTKKLWNNYDGLISTLLDHLPAELQTVHKEAIEFKQLTPNSYADMLPELEILRNEANYLGRAAILGYYFDLSSIGKWWGGSEGWQSLITIEASMQRSD